MEIHRLLQRSSRASACSLDLMQDKFICVISLSKINIMLRNDHWQLFPSLSTFFELFLFIFGILRVLFTESG
jgi:hypothetical protein